VLWPLLIERAPDEASMVQRVADQHHDVLFAEVPEPVQQLWASIGEQTWKTYATELRDA
jgi:hypothetical protein